MAAEASLESNTSPYPLLWQSLAQNMGANRIAKFFIEGHRSLVEGPDLQTHVRGSTSRRPLFGQSNQSPANALASVPCGDTDRANPTVGDGLHERACFTDKAESDESDDPRILLRNKNSGIRRSKALRPGVLNSGP
ncbi:hypothetical protein Q3Y64_05900 [Uliginosibacterium sp. 31-12]|nr:hypothetical protein [Uliginosibacterium sp. 31-12]